MAVCTSLTFVRRLPPSDSRMLMYLFLFWLSFGFVLVKDACFGVCLLKIPMEGWDKVEEDAPRM